MRHLIGIKDTSAEEIQQIFQTAEEFKEVINRPIKKVPSLRDITVANLFFENSTRTRISFELAEKRLSADVVNFSASSSSVKKGETRHHVYEFTNAGAYAANHKHLLKCTCTSNNKHNDRNILNRTCVLLHQFGYLSFLTHPKCVSCDNKGY